MLTLTVNVTLAWRVTDDAAVKLALLILVVRVPSSGETDHMKALPEGDILFSKSSVNVAVKLTLWPGWSVTEEGSSRILLIGPAVTLNRLLFPIFPEATSVNVSMSDFAA